MKTGVTDADDGHPKDAVRIPWFIKIPPDVEKTTSGGILLEICFYRKDSFCRLFAENRTVCKLKDAVGSAKHEIASAVCD